MAKTDMGQNLGDVPLGGLAESTIDTMLPGPRPTTVASDILVHPAIWPKQTWAEYWGAVPL